MDPFTLFTPTNYTFLQLESKTGGFVILAETPAIGIVKLRDGMTQEDGVETKESASTVHIKPTEPFIATLDGDMVGHGVRIAKDDHTEAEYRIVGQVEGYDFDGSQLEFYKVTLKRVSVWETSDLPLE